jgi:ribosomal protein L37E
MYSGGSMDELLYGLLSANDSLSGAMGNISVFFAIISLVFAAIYCFFGYKLFRVLMGIVGFLVFGIIGFAIGYGVSDETSAAAIIGLVTGVLGAFIMYYLYLVGVFVLIGFSGFIIGIILVDNTGASVLIGIIAGVIGVFFAKPAIIISTSISGGLLMGSSLGIILDIGKPADLLLGVIFAALGIYVQFKTNATITKKANNIQEEAIIDNKSKRIPIDTSSINNFIENTKVKLSEKIAAENELVELSSNKTAEKGTLESVFENLQAILYKNSVTKKVMPFTEYILMFFTILAIFTSFSNTIIMLVLAGLSLIRRKYEYVIVALSALLLIRLKSFLLFAKYAIVSWNISILFTYIIEFALIGSVAFVAVKYYLKLERGKMIKEKTVEYYNLLKSKSIENYKKYGSKADTPLKCNVCGESYRTKDKFCRKCGVQVNAEIINEYIDKKENNF